MKATKVLSIVMLSLLFLFSCKKDKDTAPPFSATGYWRGYIVPNQLFGILNRADGSSRVYVLTGIGDTAAANTRHDGHYTVSGDFFRFEHSGSDGYVYLETSRTTSYSMTGVYTQIGGNANIANGFPFEVIKQP